MTSARPAWSKLIDPEEQEWEWVEQRLYHCDAVSCPFQPPPASALRRILLERVYATHNSSRSVRAALVRLFGALRPDEWAMNLGAGEMSLHPRAINVDIFAGDKIDIVTSGQKLPFRRDALALVVAQEVLEHLPDPLHTIREVHRVLRPGGIFYCQVPFMIGKHYGPHDYWRFTREGLEQLFIDKDWEIINTALSVGHGTGFYRIAVEFAAVTASAIHAVMYLPVKAIAALALLPIKLADVLTPYVSEADRIPGGYLCIARKRLPRHEG